MTSIDVRAALGDRIRVGARLRGVTKAAFLTDLLDRHERVELVERFAAVRAAYARLPTDDDYWTETQVWEAFAVRSPAPEL